MFLPYMLTDNGQTVAERIGKDTLLRSRMRPARKVSPGKKPILLSPRATARSAR